MTIVKDPPKNPVPGPGVRKDSLRERPGEFGRGGFGNPATYQGSKALVPEIVASAKLEKANATRKAMKGWGLTRREARFFLEMPKHYTIIAAWRAAFPDDKASPSNQRSKAAYARRSILGKIGGEDEMMEAMGIGRQATYKTLADSLVAEKQPQFIVATTGDLVLGNREPDNQIRFAAAKFMGQAHRMVDVENKGGTVIVNIVQYNPPNTPIWPGGGRA